MNYSPWIQTRNGKAFDLVMCDPATVDPDEIADVLAATPRFGAHTIGPIKYNNAQHSVLVARNVPPRLRLPALLHDAHEVYSPFGDVLQPGHDLDPYVSRFVKALEARIDRAVADRFGVAIDALTDPLIKLADLRALATEQRDVMADPPREWKPLPEPFGDRIEVWPAPAARLAWLDELAECWGGGRGVEDQ